MKIGTIAGLAVLAAGNAQAAPDVAVPLVPAGKWVVGVEEGTCGLTRDFGRAPGVVSFGLKPTTLEDRITIVAVAPAGAGRSTKRGQARLTLLPAETSIAIQYERHGTIGDGRAAAFMTIGRTDAAAVMAAEAVRIEMGDVALAITPTAGTKALAALTTCETGLMTSWGVDPAAAAAVATPPRGAPNIADWVRVSDYPRSALARRAHGASVILWQVKSDGVVSGCRTVRSAGDADLDAAACAAIAKRARYSPALDKDGRPVVSWVVRTVTWRIP